MTYKITFETPEGYTPTLKHSGTNPALDSEGNSVWVTINGQDDMTIDSGFYQTPKYSLGNYVWYDTNKDGIQGDDEKGISGVKVTLKMKTEISLVQQQLMKMESINLII